MTDKEKMNMMETENCNVCHVTGKVTGMKKLISPESIYSFCFVVETTLPDGSRALISCAVPKSFQGLSVIKLREGEWIRVLGILNGIFSEKEKLADAWVEVVTLKRVTEKSGRKFRNEALITGNPIEGGCLIDRGELTAADFVLELESLREGGTFEAYATVPKKAVQDYVDTLGCRRLLVHGALDFIPLGEKETDPIGVTIYVDRICNAEED